MVDYYRHNYGKNLARAAWNHSALLHRKIVKKQLQLEPAKGAANDTRFL